MKFRVILAALCLLIVPVRAAPFDIPALPSIAGMEALGAASASYPNVYITDYGLGGGGGGFFTWNSASTTTVNGCTVFAATGVTTGRWLRSSYTVITPEMCGAYGDGSHNDATAINAMTGLVCGSNIAGYFDRPAYILTSTWDITDENGCNAGGTFYGNGINATNLIYKAGSNNTGNGWDTTGAAYLTFRDFSFQGGTSGGANSPAVTLLEGGACTTATTPCAPDGVLIFSGIITFQNVRIVNFQGSRVIADEGAEQISYIDCIIQGVTASVVITEEFTAGGSAPDYTSSIVTTKNPVSSMTQVHTYGSRSVFEFSGSYGIFIHFTTAGGSADITLDDYVLNNSASNYGVSILFADDSGDTANTNMTNIGGDRIQYESGGGNALMTVSALTAATVNNFHVTGFSGSGTTLTNNSFDFVAGMTVENSVINWVPNAGGSWTGSTIVAGHSGTLFKGITVLAPVAKADLLGGGTQTSYILQGVDGTLIDTTAAGSSQTCTTTTNGTLVFTGGLLTSGTCNH